MLFVWFKVWVNLFKRVIVWVNVCGWKIVIIFFDGYFCWVVFNVVIILVGWWVKLLIMIVLLIIFLVKWCFIFENVFKCLVINVILIFIM